MLREVVLDTETTGLSIRNGDKIIEIGAIELKDKFITGKKFQCYVNPQREVSQEAYGIHGISTEFLKNKSLFADIAESLLDFIGEDTLIMHNANFDVKFLNHELELIQKPLIKSKQVIDTLPMARKLFPGSRVSLDALCKRFKISFIASELDEILQKDTIDLSKLNASMSIHTNLYNRGFHGALKDALLLAYVYINLTDLKQYEFNVRNKVDLNYTTNKNIPITVIYPKNGEIELHKQFLSQLNKFS